MPHHNLIGNVHFSEADKTYRVSFRTILTGSRSRGKGACMKEDGEEGKGGGIGEKVKEEGGGRVEDIGGEEVDRERASRTGRGA